MRIYLTTAELQRRVGIARATLQKRLIERGIQPDGVAVNGGKQPGPLYDAEKLPALREALTTEKTK